MSGIVAWAVATLVASTLLILLVLAVRAPARRWIGPRAAYALWALPALRMILPWLPLGALPVPLTTMTGTSVIAIGPRGTSGAWDTPAAAAVGAVLLTIWAAGAVGLFAVFAIRHAAFCRRLCSDGSDIARIGRIRILAADVDGPLAFGVVRRFVAVPRDLLHRFGAQERDLALAHEFAHHARGDLLANWIALAVLACHWWNPIAWAAMRAFRADQEFAADADVLAAAGPGAIPVYARLLAMTAGIGAPPVCHLNTRHLLKGRLIMLSQTPRSLPRLLSGCACLTLLGTAALAVTVAKPDPAGGGPRHQAVTIGVKPDGSGAYALLVGSTLVAPGHPLPDGLTLPADFRGAGGCDLEPAAKPFAMAIKGANGSQTYTVLCASPAPASTRTTLAEGLSSLNRMRASVATQPSSAAFSETERAHALGAIDRSIHEVEATLATIG